MTKRLFDILTSSVLLIVLSPLMLLIAVVVRLSMGSPALFRQRRPGLNGELFELLKFRSMVDERCVEVKPLSDGARLTSVGRFLRTTSLDELPELWNVLRGDMSLVGPRPLLARYLPHYTERQARRHNVRPGMTGWAQVNGRNAICWEEKLEYDVWYVENHSLLLDLRILLLTVTQVILAHGISQSDHATVEAFDDYLARINTTSGHAVNQPPMKEIEGSAK